MGTGIGLEEAKKNMELCLSEDVRKQYFDLLDKCFYYSQSTTLDDFDIEVRKFLTTEEQKQSHNLFVLAFMSEQSSNSRRKSSRSIFEKHATPFDRVVFEIPDYSEYVQPSSPSLSPSTNFEFRSAASELFIPDNGFMICRVALACWKHGLDKPSDNVAELMIHACQVFIKNIITAMITRKKGFKIRDKRFQYGFNQPIPDPFLRNSSNIIDETKLSKVEVENDYFRPKCKISMEKMEHQMAYTYSCAKQRRYDNTLTVKLLFNTIKNNPKLLGLDSIHSVELFKLGLLLDQ